MTLGDRLIAENSNIEWTDSTWNPVTGCTKVSPGCAHCYAERFAKRLQLMGQSRYRNGFRLTLHRDLIDEPLRWQKRRLVFVNSMSDLFHEDIPFSFIRRVFDTMNRATRHTFQILTKRAELLAEYAQNLTWTSNIWVGVSVENSKFVWRIDYLRKVPAAVRFLSVEPLLGPIPQLPLTGMHWVIVGGESGPKARPMKPTWVREIRDRCDTANVPFFFKQWGGVNKKANGRTLDGRIWNQYPENFQLAQFESVSM